MEYPGEGGPFSIFRQKAWAYKIETEIMTESVSFSLLKIQVWLTNSGVEQWEVIVGAFYEYLGKLAADENALSDVWGLYQDATFGKFATE
jgi:hypothetical protein